jgi:alpha-amylase
MSKTNGVMMQYFHWYTSADGSLWKQVANEAKRLSELGITALWLPPAFKALGGGNSVGYDIYDLYDLGEFEQKGSIRTKYGTKDEYLKAIECAHQFGINMYADIVFNHKAGADIKERVWAQKVDWENRYSETGEPRIIEAWTKFIFPGRIKFNENHEIVDYKYSNYIWDYLCFDGVDWDEKAKEKAIFKIEGHGDAWESLITDEKGNYDFLMFSDIDFGMHEVREELMKWGKWFIEFTGVDGFRLDAIKHIGHEYFGLWLDYVRQQTGKELFTVGEYWQPHRFDILEKYLRATGFRMSLFDAPLQNKFYTASKSGSNFDLRMIFENTIVGKFPMHAVTLVDNHDTQPLQALEAPVESWFKPLAYSIILLRQDGYPCVFYPDLYGAEYTDKGRDGNDYKIVLNAVKELPKLLEARHTYAYGYQTDYFDYPSTIGWVRHGMENDKTAMAVVMTVGSEGFKDMHVGKQYSGMPFFDFLNNRKETVGIDADGNGRFTVNGGSVSLWVAKIE